MTKRPRNWDIYEAAILLEGCIEMLRETVPSNKIIERVSEDLRRMAVNRGWVIDEIFRNTAGISFQIRSMESAYTGKETLKPASRLFLEIVEIYRENPEEYARILQKAKDMLAGLPE